MLMMKKPRFFLCARCLSQVFLCSHCDRGNTYCGKNCSQQARKEARRRVVKKYQSTPAGRAKNAARQKQFRLRYGKLKQHKITHQQSSPVSANTPFVANRQKLVKAEQKKSVTHHGSKPISFSDLLHTQLKQLPYPISPPVKTTKRVIHCSFCFRECSDYLRRHFLSTCR